MKNSKEDTKKEQYNNNGFAIVEDIFSEEEITKMIQILAVKEKEYAIRQLITQKPELLDVLFSNSKFKELYNSVCTKDYFLTKAIYFNKIAAANWFVAYHQDISISAKQKSETEGYRDWTFKKQQYGVIPPKEILESTVTIRIHLDDTDKNNGALRVLAKSHKKGFIRIDETFNHKDYGKEVICNIKKGGLMLMSPLLLHASDKSVRNANRRVIHLEFCNKEIPMGWLERKELTNTILE